MQNLIEKLHSVISFLDKAYGDVSLFSLFLREDSFEEKWDIIIAAPWLDPNAQKSYTIINSALQKHLNIEDLSKISRIVILGKTNPLLITFNDLFTLTVKGSIFLDHTKIDSSSFAFNIKSAYLLRSLRK